MKIHVNCAPSKPKSKLGDKKIIHGVLHVRKIKIVNHPIYGKVLDCTGGKQRYEWVKCEEVQP